MDELVVTELDKVQIHLERQRCIRDHIETLVRAQQASESTNPNSELADLIVEQLKLAIPKLEY